MTRETLRGLIGGLFTGPRPCPLHVSPANDITIVDGVIHSTGNDPYVLLEVLDWRGFPAGRCEFAFEAAPGTVPLQPVLYLDTGAGFSEAQSIRLAGGEAGRYRQLVDLPIGETEAEQLLASTCPAAFAACVSTRPR